MNDKREIYELNAIRRAAVRNLKKIFFLQTPEITAKKRAVY
jgi:hypothetical protein